MIRAWWQLPCHFLNNVVAVLIGRPESREVATAEKPDAIETLFDQLRMRRLADEQRATFAEQEKRRNNKWR